MFHLYLFLYSDEFECKKDLVVRDLFYETLRNSKQHPLPLDFLFGGTALMHIPYILRNLVSFGPQFPLELGN